MIVEIYIGERLMNKLKPSRYNIIINENSDTLAFNSKNCAMAKVDNDFIDILNNPNSEMTKEKISLREKMYNVGFLVDEAVDEIKLLRLRQTQQHFNSNSLNITILPTDACNFSCFYCFEHKKEIRMSKQTQEETIKFIESMLDGYRALNIAWFGGEPLLSADIIWDMSDKLMAIADKRSCEYNAYMITNGFIINDAIIEKMHKYKIKRLQITLDGDEAAHNKRRCTKSGGETFNKIIENIKKLISNDYKISCRVNIDKSNANTVNTLIKRLALELGEKKNSLQISFGQILPIARLDEWDSSVCLSMEEYSALIDEYMQCMIENGFVIQDDYPFYPTPKANFCSSVQLNTFVVRPNGTIDKCWDCESMPVGNVHDGLAYNTTTEYNLAKWVAWDVLADEECKNCRVLPLCMGSCPYFSMVLKKKHCLKWKFDIEKIVKQKYNRHLEGK